MQITARSTGTLEIKTRDIAVSINDSITIGSFVLPGPGEYEVGGVMAEASTDSARFYVEDVAVGYLRPTVKKLSGMELEHLGAVDIFVFPLGGEGLAAKDASAMITQIDAPIAIPLVLDPEALTEFETLQPKAEKVSGAQKLTKSQIVGDTGRILILS